MPSRARLSALPGNRFQSLSLDSAKMSAKSIDWIAMVGSRRRVRSGLREARVRVAAQRQDELVVGAADEFAHPFGLPHEGRVGRGCPALGRVGQGVLEQGTVRPLEVL